MEEVRFAQVRGGRWYGGMFVGVGGGCFCGWDGGLGDGSPASEGPRGRFGEGVRTSASYSSTLMLACAYRACEVLQDHQLSAIAKGLLM